MTKDKTVTMSRELLPVPRELLEVIANSSERTLAEINAAIQQARSILAAPSCKVCGDSGWVPEPFSIRGNVLECPECKPATPVVERQPSDEFQYRVKPWLLDCFGEKIASDKQERNHRFLEEALELVQACGATAGEAHQLVDYVYGRDIGDPVQEVGGVMVTLAALCLAHDLDMHEAGETELARIWTKVEQIRAKQAAKPNMSPLPGAYPDRTSPPAPVAVESIEHLIAENNRLQRQNDDLSASVKYWFNAKKQFPQQAENGCANTDNTPYQPKGDWSFERVDDGTIVVRNGNDWTVIKPGCGPVYEQFLYRFCEHQMSLAPFGLPEPHGKQSNLKDTQYAMGWNACLDKVKEMNQQQLKMCDCNQGRLPCTCKELNQ